jgi:hypothetical protein
MNLTEEARRLLSCEELRGRVPEEVADFLRRVAGLEPFSFVYVYPDGAIRSIPVERDNGLPSKTLPLYTLDCVATTGCKVTTEKMEPRHDQP